MQVTQAVGSAHWPHLLELVTGQLGALGLEGVIPRHIHEHSLLIEDLGLDSLKFVDLTLRLEEALGIEEFPMQDWVDAQHEAQESLSVGALVEACASVLGRNHEASRV